MGHPSGEYASAIAALVKHQVEFVVCGGVASVFYGVPRSTLDLDILVRLTEENLNRLIEAAQALGLHSRSHETLHALKDPGLRQDWVKKKNAKVYTLQSPDSPLQIDVFLDYPIAFEEVFNGARLAVLDGLQFRVSSIEHLIQAKRAVQPPRDTDEFDLKHLQRILEHGRSP